MAHAVFRSDDNTVDHTPTAAQNAGQLIQLASGAAAVVKTDLAANELGAAYTEGIFDIDTATGTTFIAGELVVWDVSASLAINSQSAGLLDFAVGVAIAAKVSGTLVVRVRLNIGSYAKIIATAVTLTLTAADADATIYGDTQAGAFSIILPTAASMKGRHLTFIRAGTGVNALTLDGDAAETVDGAATVATMDAIRDTLTIESNGTAWFITAARIA